MFSHNYPVFIQPHVVVQNNSTLTTGAFGSFASLLSEFADLFSHRLFPVWKEPFHVCFGSELWRAAADAQEPDTFLEFTPASDPIFPSFTTVYRAYVSLYFSHFFIRFSSLCPLIRISLVHLLFKVIQKTKIWLVFCIHLYPKLIDQFWCFPFQIFFWCKWPLPGRFSKQIIKEEETKREKKASGHDMKAFFVKTSHVFVSWFLVLFKKKKMN